MKKRTLFIILLVLLVIVPCAIASAAYYYVNGTSYVRMRQLPSTSANILASYPQDFAITSYKKYNKEWTYVHFSDGHEGYVMLKYVKSSKSFTAYVTDDKTYMRSGPSMSYSVVNTLAKGAKVKVLTSGQKWDYVSYSGGKGYIRNTYLSKKYVKPSGNASTPYTAYVAGPAGETVNIRSGAGTGYSVVTAFDYGSKVTVLEVLAKWSKVQANGYTEYIKNEYLSKAAPAPYVPPVPAPDIVTPEKEPFNQYTAYIVSSNGKPVNMRQGAGTGWALVDSLPYGTKVTVVGHEGTVWYRIYANGKYGYVNVTYLTPNDPGPAPGTAEDPKTPAATHTAYITSENGKKVNVRRGAGTGFALTAQLPVGSVVTVVEDSKSAVWSHVKFGATTGYVQSKFLSTIKPTVIVAEKPEEKEEVKYPYTGYVYSENGKSVNVRRGAGTGWAVNGALNFGTQVKVTGGTGSWLKIESGKLKGYMMKKFVSKTKKDPPSSPGSGSSSESSSSFKATVKSGNGEPVNMRKGPGTGYAHIARLEVGTVVTVLKVNGKWARIQYGKLYGYMMKEFLDY